MEEISLERDLNLFYKTAKMYTITYQAHGND
jgi:hypothetical protein